MKKHDKLKLSTEVMLSDNFDNYLNVPASFTKDFYPIITIEVQPTTYFILDFGEPEYFLEKSEAEDQYFLQLSFLESISDAINSSGSPNNTTKKMTEGISDQTHRSTNFGIQEIHDTIPVYHIEFPNTLAPRFEAGVTTYIKPEDAYEILSSFTHIIHYLEEKHKNVFGYNTLEEAVKAEQYLQHLLASHSIKEVFDYHTQYFQDYIALEDTEKARERQRKIMRYIYNQLIMKNHKGSAPLSYVFESIDIKKLHSYVESLDN